MLIKRIIIIILKIIINIPLIILNFKSISDLISSLGPFYIKLAQISTTRPDILNIQIINKLKKLQDNVPYQNITISDPDIKISKNPIASGSIAQVHDCYLNDTDDEKVIKIKRHGIEKNIELDKKILLMILNTKFIRFIGGFIFGKGFSQKLHKFIKMINNSFYDHLNFVSEANNLRVMNELFKNDSKIIIPKIVDKLSNENFIVMTKIKGYNFLEFSKNNNMDYALKIFASCIYDMIFKYNIIHGDLHEGNFLIMGTTPENIKICFLDFGTVHKIPKEKVLFLTILFFSIYSNNSDLLANTMYGFSKNEELLNINKFKENMKILFKNNKQNNFNLYKFLDKLIQICNKNNIIIDESLLVPIMILIETEGIMKKYTSDYDKINLLNIFLEKSQEK